MRYFITLLVIFPSLVFAVDDATVQEIDLKASSANSKADGNNSRIQALEAEDVLINQRIDNIQLTPGPQGPQGPAGPPGPPGADGATGAQGPAGINCWDTNNNNVNDAAEDVNSDGVFNALDCSGSTNLSNILERLLLLEARLFNSDFDNDGFSPATGDCDDSNFDANPGRAEIGGDGIDNNCDGLIDESTAVDNDNDGYTPLDGDCNDADPEINPGAFEAFELFSDGIDNDCDGVIDEPASALNDYDGDGLSDFDELNTYFTDPLDPDTDGDGVSDSAEILAGTDPLDPFSNAECVAGTQETQSCFAPPPGETVCELGIQTRSCDASGMWGAYGSCVGAVYSNGGVCP